MKKLHFLFLLFIVTVVLAVGCNQHSNTQSGEALTKMYCGACHLAPTPSLLIKESWMKVLPVMSNFMGLRYSNDSIVALTGEMKYQDTTTLPQRIYIDPKDFKEIADYLIKNAPDSFLIDRHKRFDNTTLFKVSVPQEAGMPFTTAIHYDSIGKMICIGSATERALELYDMQLNKQKSIPVENMVTSCVTGINNYQITNIGAFKPEPNSVSGNIMLIDRNKQILPVKILDSLNRAVDSHIVDLDNDGKKDILVDEFGFLRGSFSWYKNIGNRQYAKNILRNTPGALKSYIEDVNHDGLPDIWTLFGQAKEGISLFINKGHGHFEEKTILQFPSVYGSTYFELVDVNGDGKKDIIYTCGDNNDYSSILKPYHGIYIYLNEGNYKFKLTKFIHVDGCYKAVFKDFNKDDILDIAAISYFADYDNHPEESFIYFEGKGNLNFHPTIIKDLPSGRWVCMDVTDVDGDGDLDILLGNLAADYLGRKDWQQRWMSAPAFVEIVNTSLSKNGHTKQEN